MQAMRWLLIVLAALVPMVARADAPRSYPAVVVRVVDGDTVRAAVDLGFGLRIEETFRLAGVDAPEVRTPEGKVVREALRLRVDGKAVTVVVLGREKYGRWLARVECDGADIAAWLLREGLARPYDGGAR